MKLVYIRAAETHETIQFIGTAGNHENILYWNCRDS